MLQNKCKNNNHASSNNFQDTKLFVHIFNHKHVLMCEGLN